MVTVPVDDFYDFAHTHMPTIANFARRRLYPLNPEELDDIVADVLIVAWRKRDLIPVGAEAPWLIGVTRKVLANARRKKYRRSTYIQSQRAEGTHRSAEDRVLKDAAVEATLATLSFGDREILMLHYWDDLTIEQIATTTGATVNAASVRLSRARKRFREAFAKFEES